MTWIVHALHACLLQLLLSRATTSSELPSGAVFVDSHGRQGRDWRPYVQTAPDATTLGRRNYRHIRRESAAELRSAALLEVQESEEADGENAAVAQAEALENHFRERSADHGEDELLHHVQSAEAAANSVDDEDKQSTTSEDDYVPEYRASLLASQTAQQGAFAVGPPGPQGNRGAQGPIGDPGPIGPKGQPGPPGPPGTNAYGHKGADGERGQRGKRGPPGPNGTTGKTGPKGPRGKPGKRGARGKDGVKARMIDCKWAKWQAWEECTKTCGGGRKRRDRLVKVAPGNGGKTCAGRSFMFADCSKKPCPKEEEKVQDVQKTTPKPAPAEAKSGAHAAVLSHEVGLVISLLVILVLCH